MCVEEERVESKIKPIFFFCRGFVISVVQWLELGKIIYFRHLLRAIK